MDFKLIETELTGRALDIIHVEDKYYIITSAPATISCSVDLKNWNVLKQLPDFHFSSIAYGNGIFVAVGSTTYGYYTSVDGINWISHPIKLYTNEGKEETAGNFKCIKFLNNNFVIVTTVSVYETIYHADGTVTNSNWEEGHILTSANGIDFNDVFQTVDTGFTKITYGNAIYTAVGTNGCIYTSKDLKNWCKEKKITSENLSGLIYGKGLFVACGENGTIITSNDGKEWNKQLSPTTSYLIRASYGNGLFFCCGYNGKIVSSLDGENWQEYTVEPKAIWYGMTYFQNKMVLIGTTIYSYLPICYIDISRKMPSYDNDCIFVYDKNLQLQGIIDTFISLTWTRKYYEAGSFNLVVAPDDNNIRLLTQKDNILIRNNYTEAGIIEVIFIDDDENQEELTVSGRFLSSVFERRIIQKTINFSGNIIEAMKLLINNCTPICSNFEIEETQISSPKISFQCSYKNLYEYLVSLSKSSSIGFRLVPNVENRVFIFENYEGLDRTSLQSANERYSFSDDQHNITKSSLDYSSKTEYNFALIGGQGEGEDRILTTVSKDEKSDFDLREIFVDARNQSNSDISASEYTSQLKQLGNEAMTFATYTFTATIDSTDYKKKWDLGDIVDIKKEKWGIIVQKRIVEVKEVIEDGKREISLVYGSPLPDIDI